MPTQIGNLCDHVGEKESGEMSVIRWLYGYMKELIRSSENVECNFYKP